MAKWNYWSSRFCALQLALKDRHSFKTEFDDEAKRYMFRHTVQPA